MFIEAKRLIGLPVAAHDVQAKVGEIQQVLVDPQDGRLLGFIISTGGFLSPKKALTAADIHDWDVKGLVTQSIENLVDPKEVVRIQNVLQKRLFLIGMKAKTESGKRLGSVEDFLIDSSTETVVKYYLNDIMIKSRVFPASKVIRIENRTIIFADDTVEVPTGAAGAPVS